MLARGGCALFTVTGGSSLALRPLAWNLLFARQPEPDLEFTEAWLDQPTSVGSPSPIQPPNQSHRRPLLWILLSLLIGIGAYVAMEPEVVTEYFRAYLKETPASRPPVAQNQTPPLGTPEKQPEQDWAFLAPKQPHTPTSPANIPAATASVPERTPPPAIPAKQLDQDWSFLAPAETPTSSSPGTTPIATASGPVKTPHSDAPAKLPERDWSFRSSTQPITRERISVSGTRASPAPMFHEGQRVSVRPDLNAPGWTVLLRQDAEGTKPGPTISPGTVLTILDGDLRGRNWVYLVRSDVGSEGWLTEEQLRFKP